MATSAQPWAGKESDTTITPLVIESMLRKHREENAKLLGRFKLFLVFLPLAWGLIYGFLFYGLPNVLAVTIFRSHTG